MPIFYKLMKMTGLVLGGLAFSFLLISCDFFKEDKVVSVKEDGVISAGDVKDRESLKAFVLAAQKEIEENSLFSALREFEKEGRWKQGSIYLFIVAQDGTSLFHPANPDFVSQNLMDYQDPNGVMVVQELIKVANAGGGFVEYLIDDPAKEGEDNSPKVTYAIKTQFDYVLGSGFYK